MMATSCQGRGRCASLAISMLLLLGNGSSSVAASHTVADSSITSVKTGLQEINHMSRRLSAKAGVKPGHYVHHGPRHSKNGKEASASSTTSDLVTTTTSYVQSGTKGGKSGKDVISQTEESTGIAEAVTSEVGSYISMTTPTMSPNLAEVAPGSLITASNSTDQNIGETEVSGSVTTSTGLANGTEMSSHIPRSKASKKEWSKTADTIYSPYATTDGAGGETTIKGGAAKAGKAKFGGDVIDSEISHEEGDPVSKAYKEPIASSVKPKANKMPLTKYFVKESSSSHHSDIENTSGVIMGGKSGKAASDTSNVDSTMSYTFIPDSGKSGKAASDVSNVDSSMSYSFTPDVLVPVPPAEFASTSPVSSGTQSGLPSPLLLLTLPPTVSPATAGTLPLGTSPPPVVGVRTSDAKFWPHEATDGTGKCEFSADYPPEFAQEQLREVYLFDTQEECCAMYEVFCLPTFPTYSPTGDTKSEGEEPLITRQGEHVVALEPFGIKLFADQAEPRYNEETVLRVTKEHLTHSFRTHGYEVDTLKLMLLEQERHLLSGQTPAVAYSAISLRWLEQHPVFVLVAGGAIEFASGAKIPSAEEIKTIVETSFSGERLTYYIELLNEADVDVANAELDLMLLQEGASAEGEGSGFDWTSLTIGLSSAFVGIGLIAFGSRQVYKRRQLSIDDLDLGKGIGEDYTIRLQYTNDELEATVDETATHDQLSVPSLVQGIEEEVNYQATPNGTRSYSSYEQGGSEQKVSPLESPQGSNEEVTKRYISVFTVKKDCGGKKLDEIDLRALAVSYLSRMLKKFPNTILLPHDKASSLPAIIHIRDIPDDLEVLYQYIGNARVDEKTGKVLFNLRVESDSPVSKMKSNSTMSSSSRRVRFNASPASDADSTPKKLPDSPKSPESMEDVDL